MATLTLSMILFLLGMATTSEAQSPGAAELPPNVFESRSPPWSYYQWWRPIRVIYENDTVLQIKQRIDSVPIERLSSVNLNEFLGEHVSSAFLYPVLASEGHKGVRVLTHFLRDYASGRPLDDRWLLTIATLGRIPLPDSCQILEQELNRIAQEYRVSASAIPIADVHIPVGDALLACSAGQGLLTPERIEHIVDRMPARKGLFWIIGLEWAHVLMSHENFLSFVEEYLAGCDDRELMKALKHQVASDRVRGIITFLSSTKDAWRLTRSVLLRPVIRRKVAEDFIGAQYLGTLSLSAEVGNGHYTIDHLVIDKLSTLDFLAHRGAVKTCWILSHYQPSMHSPRWEAFLTRHAAQLDERDRASAQYTVDRVFGRVELPPGVKISYDRIEIAVPENEPGVHLLGFGRAGGRHPDTRVRKPKND